MKPIQYYIDDGFFWCRIFGVGFSIADRNKNPPLFSVRNGYKKEFRIGKYGIKLLTKAA